MIVGIMLSRELPVRLDIDRLCKQAKNGADFLLSGTVKVSRLTNLKDLLTDLSKTIYVELSVKIDITNTAYIQGRIKAELPLLCDRCLGSMVYELEKEFFLYPIHDISQEAKCPIEYEPIVLTEGFMSVDECVTEEILLSLPLAPKHEDVNCNIDFIIN